MGNLIPVERIENRIFMIRGLKVMLDYDLAELYGVKTHVLNQAVKRNRERFPHDFMFKLTSQEYANLISQFVISSWGGRRIMPFAFTEQGIAMLSSVLRSRKAILVNIRIMRAFVKLNRVLLIHKNLRRNLGILEERFGKHLKKHDAEIQLIFNAIRRLISLPEKPTKRIGFLTDC